MHPPYREKLSSAPQTQESAALLVFLCVGLLADGSSPLVEISRHFRIGIPAEGIAAADRLQHVDVLIRYLPGDLPANHLFDLCFRDDAPVLVAVENNPQSVRSNIFPGKVVCLSNYIAQRRYLRHGHDIDLVAVAQ